MEAASAPVAPFTHEALLYGGLDGFVTGTRSFIEEGVANGQPVLVATSPEKIRVLRDVLGATASGVRFLDITTVGKNPARIIPVWQGFVDERESPEQAVRGIGEPVWPGREADELAEAQRHEVLLNLAFAATPAFRLMCPYDTEALPPSVVHEARCSHPHLLSNGDMHASDEYPGTAAFSHDTVLEPGPTTQEKAFDAGSLKAVRTEFVAELGRLELDDERRQNAALIIAELCANSIRHGGGRGVARFWISGSTFVCEVEDQGRIHDPLVGRKRPRSGSTGGYGLWVVNKLCDLVQIRSDDRCTIVRAHLSLGESRASGTPI